MHYSNVATVYNRLGQKFTPHEKVELRLCDMYQPRRPVHISYRRKQLTSFTQNNT